MPGLKRSAPFLAVLAWLGCASLNSRMPLGDYALRAMLEGRLSGIEVSELRPGLAYGRWSGDGPAGPVVVHVLAIDLKHPEFYFRPILGHDRIDGGSATRETLPDMAGRTGALAAINGDYSTEEFNVAGLLVIDGKVDFAPKPPQRSSLVIGRDRRVWMGMFQPDMDPGPDFYEAIGGGPLLVSSGTFRWTRDDKGLLDGENFFKVDRAWDERQAWTVVGLDKGGKTMFWIVVAGEPGWYSVGMTPQEVGNLLRTLGCGQAIRLEGGKASGMVLQDKLISRPPGYRNTSLPLGSALGLYAYR